MSKPDDYRANAQECQRMAGISCRPNEKALRQQMAQQWLGMIPKAESAKPDHFEARQPGMQSKTKKYAKRIEYAKFNRIACFSEKAASRPKPTSVDRRSAFIVSNRRSHPERTEPTSRHLACPSNT
jgi:hypothetical protein